jgi:hypothetical protein
MPRRFSLFVIALCLAAFTSLAQEPAITPKHSRHYALSGSSAGIAARSFLIHVPNTSFTNSSTSLCGRRSVTHAADP